MNKNLLALLGFSCAAQALTLSNENNAFGNFIANEIKNVADSMSYGSVNRIPSTFFGTRNCAWIVNYNGYKNHLALNCENPLKPGVLQTDYYCMYGQFDRPDTILTLFSAKNVQVAENKLGAAESGYYYSAGTTMPDFCPRTEDMIYFHEGLARLTNHPSVTIDAEPNLNLVMHQQANTFNPMITSFLRYFLNGRKNIDWVVYEGYQPVDMTAADLLVSENCNNFLNSNTEEFRRDLYNYIEDSKAKFPSSVPLFADLQRVLIEREYVTDGFEIRELLKDRGVTPAIKKDLFTFLRVTDTQVSKYLKICDSAIGVHLKKNL